jgi:hypothetical protein
VDGYDVWWSVGAEPNFVTDTPVSVGQTATSYLPTPPITYNTAYFWRVDTYVTWDSNEITGNFTDKIEGSVWSFTTEPSYTPVVLDSFANVITTVDIGTADLEAVISGNSTPVSAVFEILTDDAEYPAGGDAVLSNYGPSASLTTTLSASVAGAYKVKVTITDSPSTPPAAVVSAIAEVVVYADACEAKKASPGGWTANYYDQDDDCDVDVNDLRAYAVNWLDDTTLDAPASYTGLVSFVPLDAFNNRIEADWIDPNDPNACSDYPITDTTGIRIETTRPNATDSRNLGSASATAWVEYPVVLGPGTYDVYAAYSYQTNSTATLSFGTAAEPALYGTGTFPTTGNWNNFVKIHVGEITITAPITSIRTSYSAGFNLDWFSFDLQ